MLTNVSMLVKKVIDKMISWIDQLFSIFGAYSTGYSKYLVYALMLFIISKFVKLNLKVDTKKA